MDIKKLNTIDIILIILIGALIYFVALNNWGSDVKDNFDNILDEYKKQQDRINEEYNFITNKRDFDSLTAKKIELDTEINNYYCNKCKMLGGMDNSCNMCRITKRVEHDALENESLAPNATRQEPANINTDIINNPNNMTYAVKSPTSATVAPIAETNAVIANNQTTKYAGHPHTSLGFADVEHSNARPVSLGNPVFYYDNPIDGNKTEADAVADATTAVNMQRPYFEGTPEIVNVYAPTFKYVMQGDGASLGDYAQAFSTALTV